MAKKQEFYVSGDGPFPFDMLRYDQCWPANESSSFILAERGMRVIEMVSNTRITPGRWESYGWRLYPKNGAWGSIAADKAKESIRAFEARQKGG